MKNVLALPTLAAALVLVSACSDKSVSAPDASATQSVRAGASSSGASPNGNAGITLHPSGFGADALAAWRAQEGLPDTHGNADQALYFQKFTSTTTNSAGIAVVEGVAGTPSEQLGLSWDHREDGHCGAGAPRWDVVVQPVGGGAQQTLFLGCNASLHTEVGAYNGHGWCRDTQPSLPAGFTVTALYIVFDEGTDTPNPPPAGCAQENLLAGGFVYLDNITVTANGQTKVFTSPADNGQ